MNHTLNIIVRIFAVILLWLSLRPATHAQFSIGPGGWVTVKSGSSMRIGTDLHIISTAAGSGYLVDQNVNGEIDITGDASIERYLTPNVWHNVSSPVSSETSGAYTGTDLVFWYNEALILNDWNFGWVWYSGATGGPLQLFRGYDVYYANSAVTIDYQATAAESVNTGPYSITVINTTSTPSEIPSHKGWNLLGNPYPSPVDWLSASGWDKAAINDAKYIWDGANNIYTIFIGGGSPVGINGGTRFIPSNQGFWVQSIVASGTVSIHNATRVGDISGTPDFYKLEPIDYPLVSLLATGGGYRDEAVIRFIEGTTSGFDINWDATKLLSLDADVPQLIIKHGSQSLALNTLPELYDGLTVVLDFKSARAGVYDIRLSSRTTMELSSMIYLKDELENKTVCLSTDSSYSFHHEPYENSDRFRLFFNPDDDIINNITPDSWFSVFSSGNQVTIIKNTVKEMDGEIHVFNMLGQPVHSESLSGDRESTLNLALPMGYYVVSLVTAQHTTNTKIFIAGS